MPLMTPLPCLVADKDLPLVIWQGDLVQDFLRDSQPTLVRILVDYAHGGLMLRVETAARPLPPPDWPNWVACNDEMVWTNALAKALLGMVRMEGVDAGVRG